MRVNKRGLEAKLKEVLYISYARQFKIKVVHILLLLICERSTYISQRFVDAEHGRHPMQRPPALDFQWTTHIQTNAHTLKIVWYILRPRLRRNRVLKAGKLGAPPETVARLSPSAEKLAME
jgi:hypothetical protein